MSRKTKSPADDAILVNRLTVGDAAHLVRTEGGSLSTGQIAVRATSILAIAAFTARAILVGQATAWHLFLPMVAEYLALLLALPVLAVLVKDGGLRREACLSLRWSAGLLGIVSLWVASRAFDSDLRWTVQAEADLSRFLAWITSHQMQWPILGAMAAMVAGLPSRVAAFRRHGPPFMAAGLGCATRLLVPLSGCFLLPLVASGTFPVVWAIWTILLVSELGALAIHWDLQRRLTRRGINV